MGIIKGCLKVVGTAALVVTGSASTILKGVSDAVGIELGSELFGATKDASFNGIRNMWNSESVDKAVDKGEATADRTENFTRSQMADTAYQAAQTAKRLADTEKDTKKKAVYLQKYNDYMSKYYEYK